MLAFMVIHARMYVYLFASMYTNAYMTVCMNVYLCAGLDLKKRSESHFAIHFDKVIRNCESYT